MTKKTVFISILIIMISVVLLLLKSLKKNSGTPLFFNKSSQTLERTPTDKIITTEIYPLFNGEIQEKNGKYVGYIEGGRAYIPKDEDKKEFSSRLQVIKKDPGYENSLFVYEARDINDNVLLSMPLGVSYSSPGSDMSIITYDKPGYFSEETLLPPNTNSLVLKEKTGKVLDRIYVEDWEPSVNFIKYPAQVGATDKFNIELELLPQEKAFEYTLYLRNIRNSSEIFFIGGATSPKKGRISETIDLNGFPFTQSGDWVIEADSYSFFRNKTTTTDPIKIKLSSENIEVKISGKDIKVRKSGDSDYIIWSHVFYEIGASSALEELCKKGRCFELVWSGENIEFNERYWDPNPVSTITTQKNSLQCSFRGAGEQTIRLQVKENGNIIGEDTYTYTVSGKSNEKTLCQIFE